MLAADPLEQRNVQAVRIIGGNFAGGEDLAEDLCLFRICPGNRLRGSCRRKRIRRLAEGASNP
jgi:hypothetical protein